MAHTVTLVYSNHRPETLRHAESIMERHDAVILEEPPTTGFRVMQPVVHSLGGRRRGLGPGDVLTLGLTANADLQCPMIDLLAARNLVYNRIVHHEEMLPGNDPYPHTRDEVEASRRSAGRW